VAGMEDAPLQTALERLAEADILLVQGLPPSSDYRFKHALIQDAAYENLLRSRRTVLHRRIAEALRDRLADSGAAEPELLAHHFTQAGLTEAAIEWWDKAGQRSLDRSALVEAVEQFTRALNLIENLNSTPALRRGQIKLQVALITPLIHVRGYAAPETKAAVERARSLIQQAQALGEPPDDPLLLFSVLFGWWGANAVAFNADACLDLASQFLALAEKQEATGARLIAHRIMGQSLALSGHIAEARLHYDKGLALYDPIAHRPLATRFATDSESSFLSFRSWCMWLLGYPDAALADADRALSRAREFGHAAMMHTMFHLLAFHLCCRNYTTAAAIADEFIPLAEDKGAALWKAIGLLMRGCIFAEAGKASDAIETFAAAIAAYRATGATVFMPFVLPFNARAYAILGQFDNAWVSIHEALKAANSTKERWCEPEVHRVAGDIVLMSPERDVVKAEAYFGRALAVAREQQAKSWELRAAMSMARLWREHGKRAEARDLLAPVYGWFTEGFATLDLKEAKALLDELAA
jgi:predicted ATPase